MAVFNDIMTPDDDRPPLSLRPAVELCHRFLPSSSQSSSTPPASSPLPKLNRSPTNSAQQQLADNSVFNFRRFVSALCRNGHARFRLSQVQPLAETELFVVPPVQALPASPPPPPPVSFSPQTLTLYFTKPATEANIAAGECPIDDWPPISGSNSSFLSSITSDGSISNGKSILSSDRPPISKKFLSSAPISGSHAYSCPLSSDLRPASSSSRSPRQRHPDLVLRRSHCRFTFSSTHVV